MRKVLDMASHIVKEESVSWVFMVKSETVSESYDIQRVGNDNKFVVTILCNSFERLPDLRAAVLQDLKQRVIHNQI